jgi:hypothetical protein
MKFDYYYNIVPGDGQCRNNLIYTSLISEDKKTFVQWYFNDKIYHKDQNQVVKEELMFEKWSREVKYLTLMSQMNPELVPKILDIDHMAQKIYLEIDGVDFWQRSLDGAGDFNNVLPDWQEQMLHIIKTHEALGLHKYSMHPSSYFIVGGKLKSINYFFTYHNSEPQISIADVESHIYSTRQDEMKKHIGKLGIDWFQPQPWRTLDMLCWESFRKNYTDEFIERAKGITS